ncbi:MAG: hypothetical protein JSU87_15160 [Gemmatimonadota bacterium]|nr:MAG: hypothetical protein JSU87_15160 [Gemmatimonadota bacterium]
MAGDVFTLEELTSRMSADIPRGKGLDGGTYGRALASGTIVALAAAALTGLLRNWIWILALEPIAVGVVIGEAAAVPSSARKRRPPVWSYVYVFVVAALGYVLIHVFFWLSSESFMPSQSLFAFLKSAPSATATPFFQSVDLARGIALATGGATTLKYWIWVIEGLLMASSAALAHFGASVRRLKT